MDNIGSILAPTEVINTFSDPVHVVSILGMATLFGWMIAWTYNKTRSMTKNRFELETTLIFMTVVAALIIMIIGGNMARAIGIFGAFSIIRFRSPMKNPRDTAFVFFSLSAGLAAGAGALVIGLVGVFFICALALFLDYSHVFGLRKTDYVLTFRVSTKHYADAKFKEVIERYVHPDMKLNIAPTNDGRLVAFTFSISMNKKRVLNNFVKELSELKGVTKINISSPRADLAELNS